MLRKTVFVIFVALSFTGCEKISMPDKDRRKPVDIFNEVWEGVDQTYSLFEYSDVDWDEMKELYSRQIYSWTTDKELYVVLSNMLFELKDGHTNLYPGDDDITRLVYDFTKDYREDYNITAVRDFMNANVPVIEIHNNYKYCIIKDHNIGFMMFNGYFRSQEAGEEAFIDMLEYFSDTKAMILDLRRNGGGETRLVQMMLSHFTYEKLCVGKVKYKMGPGHNDFTDWEFIYHNPRAPYYSKPVVILTNRGVYSAANDMVLYSKSYPNITTVGGLTGGGIGIPIRHLLPNGWYYRTSGSVTALPDGSIYPDGIQPDVIQHTDSNSEHDMIINRAVSILSGESS